MQITINEGMLREIDEKFPGADKFIGKRLLICGSRDYNDRQAISSMIFCFEPSILINGCARGADALANEEARKQGIKVEEYPAAWSVYGRSAGLIRNILMLEEGKPDIVIAFYSGKITRGTQHMVRGAKEAGVFVVELGLARGD